MAALTPGQSWTTPGRTIGAGDINLFAGLVGDFTPIHVDEVFAKSSPYGTRIAHGPLAMATAIGMLTQTGILGERVIGLLNLNWDFSGPVKIDDTIRSRVTLEQQRPTSKPSRAVATFVFEVINQRNEVVQRGSMLVLLRADDESKAESENKTGA
jgi:acyl dehydratase